MTSMGPVDRFQVLPLHHQVGIGDLDTVDVPRWDSGEEPLVTGDHCILVATRDDLDPVDLEVWVGPPTTPPPGPLLFDGALRTTPARAGLGSPAQAGARIALAICEVEAGLRSPLQLERLCQSSRASIRPRSVACARWRSIGTQGGGCPQPRR
jgi:hypothetical protein